ncbi:MAG: hypothetical protein KA477_01555 [Candidatus Levybacteria bacterium]|nr:hypothetical protein [Candidatus Levybacteria bacterium]
MENIPPAPNTSPADQGSQSLQIQTSSLYDQGFNKKTWILQYFFVRVWPPAKRIIEETAYSTFKLLRSILKFALVQMGIKSGN